MTAEVFFCGAIAQNQTNRDKFYMRNRRRKKPKTTPKTHSKVLNPELRNKFFSQTNRPMEKYLVQSIYLPASSARKPANHTNDRELVVLFGLFLFFYKLLTTQHTHGILHCFFRIWNDNIRPFKALLLSFNTASFGRGMGRSAYPKVLPLGDQKSTTNAIRPNVGRMMQMAWCFKFANQRRNKKNPSLANSVCKIMDIPQMGNIVDDKALCAWQSLLRNFERLPLCGKA